MKRDEESRLKLVEVKLGSGIEKYSSSSQKCLSSKQKCSSQVRVPGRSGTARPFTAFFQGNDGPKNPQYTNCCRATMDSNDAGTL